MVYEVRKQSMAWMETDYSKHTYFRWKIKWRLERLGALGIMDETAPLRNTSLNMAHCKLRVTIFLYQPLKGLSKYTVPALGM